MWINGKALHEVETAELKALCQKFFAEGDYTWSNAIIEELERRG